MGISGLIGAGATDALDDIIQQQLEKKRFAEAMRAQQVQEAAQQQQIAQASQRMAQEANQFTRREAGEQTRFDANFGQRREEFDYERTSKERDYDDTQAGMQAMAEAANDPALPDPIRRIIGLSARSKGLVKSSALGPDDVMSEAERATKRRQEGDETIRIDAAGADQDIRRDRARQQAEFEYSERAIKSGAGSGASASDGKAYEIAAEAKRLAAELLNEPGLDAAFGPIQSRIPTLLTNTSNATAKVNRLKALLTADNIGLLKGVLSDSDMILLGRIGTSLDETMGEGAARQEIQRVIDMPIQMNTGRAPVRVGGVEMAADGVVRRKKR